MVGLDPVEETDVFEIFADLIMGLGEETTASTVRHFATLKKLADTGRLVADVRADAPAEIPWILVSCQPSRQDLAPIDVAENLEELQLLFTKSIASVGETRWTEDGLILVDSRTRVVDAGMFNHDHRVEVFTRSPLVGRKTKEGFDINGNRLEALLIRTGLMARDWYISMDVDCTIYVDVSLVSVEGAQLDLGGRAIRRFGGFTRDYVHVAAEWDYSDEDAKFGLDWLCDRMWQAGAMNGSRVEKAGDPRG